MALLVITHVTLASIGNAGSWKPVPSGWSVGSPAVLPAESTQVSEES